MRYLVLLCFLLPIDARSTALGIEGTKENTNISKVTAEVKPKVEMIREAFQRKYEKAETLQQGIAILKSQLREEGLGMYEQLFTVEKVKFAIHRSVDSLEKNHQTAMYRTKTAAESHKAAREERNFRKLCEPVFREMANSNKWMPGSYFDFTRKEQKLAGIRVRLHILAEHEIAPGRVADGYVINILDLTYGLDPIEDSIFKVELSSYELPQ